MVNGVSSIDLQHNPYGSIRRKERLDNGRILYHVVDSNGRTAGMLTVPEKQMDTFEKSYNEIITTAPIIQKYVAENSSEDDRKLRRIKSQAIVTIGGAFGALVPLMLTWKKSPMQKILSTGAGIVLGVAAGFVAAFISSLPPGTFKFEKASHTLAGLDIQPVVEQ